MRMNWQYTHGKDPITHRCRVCGFMFDAKLGTVIQQEVRLAIKKTKRKRMPSDLPGAGIMEAAFKALDEAQALQEATHRVIAKEVLRCQAMMRRHEIHYHWDAYLDRQTHIFRSQLEQYHSPAGFVSLEYPDTFFVSWENGCNSGGDE